MIKLNDLVELMGEIRTPNHEGVSAASRGFDTSFLAWLSAPKNLNRDKILALALVYNLGNLAEKISIATDNAIINSLYTEAHSANSPEADFVRWINLQESRDNYPSAATYIDSHKSILFKLLKDLNQLKRSGWKRHDVSEAESVAEHSYGVCLLSLSFCPETLDCEKMTSMALIHDVQEASTGDYTPFDSISAEEKDLREYKDAKKIAKALNNKEMFDLFQEQQVRQTLAAKMLKDIDKVDAVLLAQYYDNHNRGSDRMIPEFLTFAEKIYNGGYDYDLVKSIYNQLRAQQNKPL